MKEILDVENIRKQLEGKRAVLLSRVRVKQEQSGRDDTRNRDRSDLAQDYFLQERQAALTERMEDTLERVEAALQRLDEGVYGRCTRCGENISPERLAALPYAEHCMACEEKLRGEPNRR